MQLWCTNIPCVRSLENLAAYSAESSICWICQQISGLKVLIWLTLIQHCIWKWTCAQKSAKVCYFLTECVRYVVEYFNDERNYLLWNCISLVFLLTAIFFSLEDFSVVNIPFLIKNKFLMCFLIAHRSPRWLFMWHRKHRWLQYFQDLPQNTETARTWLLQILQGTIRMVFSWII